MRNKFRHLLTGCLCLSITVATIRIACACTSNGCENNKCVKFIEYRPFPGWCITYEETMAFAPNSTIWSSDWEDEDGTALTGETIDVVVRSSCCRGCVGNAPNNDGQDAENITGMIISSNSTGQRACD